MCLGIIALFSKCFWIFQHLFVDEASLLLVYSCYFLLMDFVFMLECYILLFSCSKLDSLEVNWIAACMAHQCYNDFSLKKLKHQFH